MKKSDTFENHTTEYEIQRLEDNKAFLLHFVHSKLAFHTKSVETLLKLYSEINNYEPKGELCVEYKLLRLSLKNIIFLKTLTINNFLRDLNLLLE